MAVTVHTCLHLMLPFLSGCSRVKREGGRGRGRGERGERERERERKTGEREGEREGKGKGERSPISLREHIEITGGL